jgi:hypothetical protein
MEPVEVNAQPGIPSRAFAAHKSPVESKKYFKGEAIEPNLVGDPKASPEQFKSSSFEQYISPSFGIAGSDDSGLDEI